VARAPPNPRKTCYSGRAVGLRTASLAVLLTTLGAWGVLRAQRPFKEYPTIEAHAEYSLPSDWNQITDWTRARLHYHNVDGGCDGFFGRRDGSWTIDYPRSDRHLLQGIKRLTRIDARSVEQVVDLDNTDDVYNWPFMYAVEVGHWYLNQEEAAQLRDFINRGGFLMVDDFHADCEWEVFVDSMKRVFPDREIVDLPNNDPIFHTVSDLDDRYQIPGAQYLRSGRTYEKDESGRPEHWRGIYDDKGRVVVAICHNMDLGDAWEWSDEPAYPEKWASLAYRIAVNYSIYDLTH
jgi:Domain of unknown function (DUF4159)